MQRITCMGPTAAPLLSLTAATVAEPSSTTTAVAAYTPTACAAPIDEAARNVAIIAAALTRVREATLALAREIRYPNVWIGYIAFIMFGMLKQCRPHCWEGTNKLGFIEQFALWAVEMCAN